MYQPAPPVPNIADPPPIHCHRPAAQTNAVVITPSNPTEKPSNQSEAPPESDTKFSVPTKTPSPQSEASPELYTKSPGPIEYISQQPKSKKAVKRDQHLARIQESQSFILGYKPTAQDASITNSALEAPTLTVQDALVTNPALEVPTQMAHDAPISMSAPDVPTLESIRLDFEYIVLSEPECKWTLGDIPVGLSR